jgi:hypothetical protein
VVGDATALVCYAMRIRAEVTRSQNTTLRRVVARFCKKRSCSNLQKREMVKKIKWLTEVCFAVRMRVAAGNGDVMERELERDDA